MCGGRGSGEEGDHLEHLQSWWVPEEVDWDMGGAGILAKAFQ